ncbi:MAG: hypothetical protein MGF17_13280, partial [Trichodesmium sp. MAG_R04]|nr:hypothetical protein [Trichodesmium sp. MAG_R04]
QNRIDLDDEIRTDFLAHLFDRIGSGFLAPFLDPGFSLLPYRLQTLSPPLGLMRTYWKLDLLTPYYRMVKAPPLGLMRTYWKRRCCYLQKANNFVIPHRLG